MYVILPWCKRYINKKICRVKKNVAQTEGIF